MDESKLTKEKKHVEVSLIPDKGMHKFNMIKNGETFKELNVSPLKLKGYMKSKFQEDELDFIRKTIKVFKVKDIKIHLKE